MKIIDDPGSFLSLQRRRKLSIARRVAHYVQQDSLEFRTCLRACNFYEYSNFYYRFVLSYFSLKRVLKRLSALEIFYLRPRDLGLKLSICALNPPFLT